MDDAAIFSLFQGLYADILEENEFYQRKPHLAHYTSLAALENILKSEELWFSNPLFMNDLEEVRFGIVHGANALKESEEVRASLGTEVRHTMFSRAFEHYMATFEREHLLDTYVFCMSEHSPDNTDGLLSMWRGYGGNGKGAALVFDTSKISPVGDSPLIVNKVEYEPKLHLKIAPLEGVADVGLSMENILGAILLGPTTSSPLAIRSVGRMRWPRLFGRFFRFDEWSLCRG